VVGVAQVALEFGVDVVLGEADLQRKAARRCGDPDKIRL
jgi:hypothetical protein